jgi:hypothetical protein
MELEGPAFRHLTKAPTGATTGSATKAVEQFIPATGNHQNSIYKAISAAPTMRL